MCHRFVPYRLSRSFCRNRKEAVQEGVVLTVVPGGCSNKNGPFGSSPSRRQRGCQTDRVMFYRSDSRSESRGLVAPRYFVKRLFAD
ncbi:hypothetical protein VN12_20095 [Pirellula sp. SH-Sr6A]|nr:hypothetical protein VN12_20095 [Pirellula sp. SH-Sr6A]